MLLDDIEIYHNHVKNLDPNELHPKAVQFLSCVDDAIKNTSSKQAHVSKAAKKCNSWLELQGTFQNFILQQQNVPKVLS